MERAAAAEITAAVRSAAAARSAAARSAAAAAETAAAEARKEGATSAAEVEATATATRMAVAGRAAANTEGNAVTETTAAKLARTAEGREAIRQRKQRRRPGRQWWWCWWWWRRKRISRVSCVADSSPTEQAACSGSLLLFDATRYGWQVLKRASNRSIARCAHWYRNRPVTRLRQTGSPWVVFESGGRRKRTGPGADRALNLRLTVYIMVSQSCCPCYQHFIMFGFDPRQPELGQA